MGALVLFCYELLGWNSGLGQRNLIYACCRRLRPFMLRFIVVQEMKDCSFWEFWGSRGLGFCWCGKLAPALGIGTHILVTEHQWALAAMTLLIFGGDSFRLALAFPPVLFFSPVGCSWGATTNVYKLPLSQIVGPFRFSRYIGFAIQLNISISNCISIMAKTNYIV